MPTFLTNRKMPPALADRVRTSVSGGRTQASGRSVAPRVVATLRFGAVFAIAALVATLFLMRQQARAEIDSRRHGLLERVRKESAALTPAEQAMTSRVLPLLAESAGPYAGDRVTDAVRGLEALSATLSRPMVYVRGPVDGFSSAVRVAENASASFRDPFVLCLIDPPAARTEAALLRRTKQAFAGGPRVSPAKHVERLHDALLGLPYLSPAWEQRLKETDTRVGLDTLRAGFDEAPVGAAVRAAKADLLLSVLDEPNDGSGPTELDGACPHFARVELVELATGKVLLRLRRHVDPGWISPKTRVEHAKGITACELALDVRESVAPPASPD